MTVLTNFAVAFALCLASGNAGVLTVSNEPTKETPFPLQSAINRAVPGDIIQLTPGVYFECIHSVIDGTADAPITIKGPKSAIIRASVGDAILIQHDHIHLQGFSVDGAGSQGDTDSLEQRGYDNHLIHVYGNRIRTVNYASHTHRSAVVGFTARDLSLSEAGTACLKISSFVTHAIVTDNDISQCGRADENCVRNKSGCGAGIDLGTTISTVMENVDGEVDETAWNKIKGNEISEVRGACIVLHEGTRLNIIADNTCRESQDEHGAGIDIRGDMNIIRNNNVKGASGAGLGLGGAKTAIHQYGIFNQVYMNELTRNDGGSILNGEIPQPSGLMCSNAVDNDTMQDLVKECPEYDGMPWKELNSEDIPDGPTRVDIDPQELAPSPVPRAQQGNTPRPTQAPSSTPPGQQTEPHAESQGGGRGGNGGGDDDSDDSGIDKRASGQNACRQARLSTKNVKSSEVNPDSTGDSPEVVLDGDRRTHWSRYGFGQWLEFILDTDGADERTEIQAVEIQFYGGKSRVQYFQVVADGKEIIHEGMSSGTTDDPELFDFKGGPVAANIIRIVFEGNQPKGKDAPYSLWNSVVGVKLCQPRVL